MSQPPQPCGSRPAYRRHLRRGERCAVCLEGERQRSAEKRRARGARERGPLQPCGTPAAYWRHRYHRETPCPACAAARQAERRAIEGSTR